MILVLLGTQDKPFIRILEEVSKLKEKGVIKDKVIAQVGCTKYESKYIDSFDFLPKETIEGYVEDAKYIITHGGVGTIIECLKHDKKTIVIPRLKKYKEHTNDHQLQITKEFANKNYVLPLYNEKELKKIIDKLKDFVPNKYESNKENFNNKIKEYIDNL